MVPEQHFHFQDKMKVVSSTTSPLEQDQFWHFFLEKEN